MQEKPEDGFKPDLERPVVEPQVSTNVAVDYGATPDADSDFSPGASSASIQQERALRKELAKWRERVPKLAQALKERTEQVDKLEEQLAGPAQPRQNELGAQARQTMIDELEGKIKDLNTRYHKAEGELHSREVELKGTQADLESWKRKWQEAMTGLDSHTDVLVEKDLTIKRTRDEVASLSRDYSSNKEILALNITKIASLEEENGSLTKRNDSLFQTTEMANKQLETLADDLGDLRARNKAKDVEIQELNRRVVEEQNTFKSAASDINGLNKALEEKAAELAAAVGRLKHSDEAQHLLQVESSQSAKLAADKQSLQAIVTENQSVLMQMDQDLNNALVAGVTEKVAAESRLEQVAQQLAEQIEANKELDRARVEQSALAAQLTANLDVNDHALGAKDEEIKDLGKVIGESVVVIDQLKLAEQSKAEELLQTNDRVSRLRSDNDELNDKLTRERKEASVWQDEKIRLENQVSQQATELDSLSKNIAEQSQRLEAMAQEKSELSQQVLNADNLQQQAKTEYANTQTELQSLQRDSGEQVKSLEQSLFGAEEDKSRLKQELAEAQGKANSLGQVESELSSLQRDSAQQIETLERTLASSEEANTELTRELSDARQQANSLGEVESELAKLQQDSSGKVNSLTQSLADSEQVTAKLTRELAEVQSQANSWLSDKSTLNAEIQEYRGKLAKLDEQLVERSELVVVLEKDKDELANRVNQFDTDNSSAIGEVDTLKRNREEDKDHITQLASKLERQQELMLSLEEELAEAQEELGDFNKAKTKSTAEQDAVVADLQEKLLEAEGASVDLEQTRAELAEREALFNRQLEKAERDSQFEIRELKEERDGLSVTLMELEEKVRSMPAPGRAQDASEDVKRELLKLENTVRERTEELNRVRWQQELKAEAIEGGSDNKLMLVLNQQLADARAENQRLTSRLAEVSEESITSTVTDFGADDLTQIKGIGDKLAKQLQALGYVRLAQIAELDIAALDDELHPLNGHKGRILKDDWQGQAKKLSS